MVARAAVNYFSAPNPRPGQEVADTLLDLDTGTLFKCVAQLCHRGLRVRYDAGGTTVSGGGRNYGLSGRSAEQQKGSLAQYHLIDGFFPDGVPEVQVTLIGQPYHGTESGLKARVVQPELIRLVGA